MRREGGLPGVIYGGGGSVPISLNRKEMVRLLNTGSAGSALITVKMDDGSEKMAIIRDYQATPAKNELIHVDFMEVAMDKPIHMTVSLTLVEGDPVGVKEGGMLQMPLREVTVSCLPMAIPETILIDALEMNIGDTMHMSDVKMPEGVTLLGESDLLVVSISAPVTEEELEESLAGEEGVAAAPEVVGGEGESGKE
jgi:large subunit ribosomal protein L25